MKAFYLMSVLLLFTACKTQTQNTTISIDKSRLLEHVKAISHDSTEGRAFGTEGNYKTQAYVAKQFKALDIPPAIGTDHIQTFQHTFSGKLRQRLYPLPEATDDANTIPDTTITGGNVVAMLKGKSNKSMVITAHLDHLGIRNGDIYNGADDDASGTAALLEMAAYFKDKSLNHTLIFAAVDAEEIGSQGCEYLLNNFPMDTSDIVLNVNMDMIAHNDSLQLYAAGLYHYPKLKPPLTNLESPITLLFGHDDPNDKTKDDWTFSSDHRIFHKRGIPFIYFGVEDHKDYHKPTDTFENINEDFYVEAVRLIIQVIENYDDFLSKD